MGALDDHNHQHTYGKTLGAPTSVAGVSAQQAIDAHNRLVEASPATPTTGSVAPGARAHLVFASVSGGIALAAGIAAYVIGGIGAVALGIIAAGAAMFTAVFLIAALIEFTKSVVSSRR